jgi:ParB/RepB/Spo0J family partition protein
MNGLRDRKMEYIPVGQIVPNERNPRAKRHFKTDELVSLRRSIEEHGILEPVLVQPYRDGAKEDRYLLVEGERRYTVAKTLGFKEIPALIGGKLDDHDQLVVMYNVHSNRRAWEVAEQLRTIKELRERNGGRSDEDIAKELGMSLATFKDRLKVLEMPAEVLADIAAERLDYSSALRIGQVTSSLSKKRPDLVKRVGGAEKIQRKLIAKAKTRGGISQELVEAKKDLTDTGGVSDEVVEQYIEEPTAKLRDLRKAQESLEERRKTEGLARNLRRTSKEIEAFDVDLEEVPNLRELRAALGQLIDAAQDLEGEVVQTLLSKDD